MRIDHVGLAVSDLESAGRWYVDILGLCEVARQGESRFLGCGGRPAFDLELKLGSGLDHVAYRAASRAELELRRETLAAAGLAVATLDGGQDPGAREGISNRLPNGLRVDIVLAPEADAYVHAAEWDPAGVESPRELDHVTVTAADVDAVVQAATAGLGLGLSDVQQVRGKRVAAWLRAGDRHHDFAVAAHPSAGLHHIAYQLPDAAALVAFADRLVRLGGRAEYGIGRHGPGSNLFLYVRDPGGNRVELCCDMAIVPPGAPHRVWEGTDDRIMDVWASYSPPPSFGEIS